MSTTRIEYRTTLGDIGRGILRMLCVFVAAIVGLWVAHEPISFERVSGMVLGATVVMVYASNERISRVMAGVLAAKNGTHGTDGTDGGVGGGGRDPK